MSVFENPNASRNDKIRAVIRTLKALKLTVRLGATVAVVDRAVTYLETEIED